MRTHQDLDVWKRSIDFVSSIYKMIERFPSNEQFGFTSQIRRSAVSIRSNISEGVARNNAKDFNHFSNIFRLNCKIRNSIDYSKQLWLSS